MLDYVKDVAFPDDDVLERARRVEIYREQVERFGQMMDVPDRCRMGPFARPVFCEQLKDQFPNGFATLRAAAAFLGASRAQLRTAIRNQGRCKGYRFRYIEGAAPVRVRTGRERRIRCLNDGTVCASLTEAAQHGGVSCSAICGALRRAKGAPAACAGRLWQYVQDENPCQLYLFDAVPLTPRRKRRAPEEDGVPIKAPVRVVQLSLFDQEPFAESVEVSEEMNEDLEIVCSDAIHLPLADDEVNLVLFSPPYEDARQYGELDFKLHGQDWVGWMVPRFLEAARVCKGLVVCVVNGRTKDYTWSGVPFRLWCALSDAGLHMRKPPIYQRDGIPGSGGPDWFKDNYEFALCGSRHPGRLPWSDNTAMGHPPVYPPGGAPSHRMANGQRVQATYKPPERANPGNVIRCVVGGGHMGHPLAHENEAPFPEYLAEWFIRSCCPPGGIVLDVMAGSGTTLAVAQKCGRRAIGVDIRLNQCDLMQRRLEAEVGIKPSILLGTEGVAA